MCENNDHLFGRGLVRQKVRNENTFLHLKQVYKYYILLVPVQRNPPNDRHLIHQADVDPAAPACGHDGGRVGRTNHHFFSNS